MAKQTINLGTGELTGDGESIRSAFDKINDNFDELYAKDATDVDLSAVSESIIPDTNEAYDLGSASNRFRDLYLSGSTIDLGGTTISVVGGELQLGGVKVITQSELDVVVQNDITTNLKGSVFADDSTLLVDGINGKINLNGTVLDGLIGTSEENLRVESGKISLNSTKSDSLFTDTGGSYTSASWSGNNIDFTAVDDIYLETLMLRFFDHFDGSGFPWHTGYSNITVRINDTQTLTVTGAEELGGGDWRVTVAETPASDPTAVTSAEFFYDFTSAFVFDANNNVYAIALDNSNLRINTRRDIRLESGDDIYIDGRSNMRLRNYSRTSGITIETDFNNEAYEWLFDEVGTLTTPGDITVAGDITGTSSSSTLYLKAEPSSNTYIQLNDTVDSTINTVADLEIRTDVANAVKTWIFGTDGTLTFPDSTVQNTAYPGIVSTHNGQHRIEVGGQTATMDSLRIRLAFEAGFDNTNVELNYDPDSTTGISVDRRGTNLIGVQVTAPGNTNWVVIDTLNTAGDGTEFVVTDHSLNKIYRVTVTVSNPHQDGAVTGDAYCVIERLK